MVIEVIIAINKVIGNHNNIVIIIIRKLIDKVRQRRCFMFK